MDEQKVKALIAGGAGQSPLGRRTIPRIDFKPDRSLVEKLPVDMVMTDIELTIHGWILPTWASGTPTANPKGVLESLVEYIKVEASSKTIKKLTPKQIRFMKSFVYAKQSPSFNKVNATNLKGAVTNSFSFGTSGQKVFVSETITIPYALFISITPELTYFDTSKHLQTNLEIQTHDWKNLVSGGDAVDFVVSDHSLAFEAYARTSDNDLGKPFLTFRQDYTEEVFSGANKSRKLDIQRNSKLMGMTIEVVKVDNTTDVVTEIDIGEAHGVKFSIMANGQVTDQQKLDYLN